MSSRVTTVANLFRCYDDLEALLGDLQPDEWDVQSLCPDWTIRSVVVHLAVIEHVLSGWAPSAEDITPPFERISELAEQGRGWSDEELAAETRKILAARRSELEVMTDDAFAHRSMTPVGEGTYQRFMEIRIFDLWVHQRDMTIPLGRASDDSGPTAVAALDEVNRSIGYIVGKKIGLPDGHSITFSLSGPVERDIHVVVDGRAAAVEHLDDPTVTVSADSTTFIMLACGRLDPGAMIEQGHISWSGDDTWGEQAARNLRFTM